MSDITQKQIVRAYELAKDGLSSAEEKNVAIKELHEQYEMNEASASYYIQAILKMLAGEEYNNTIKLQGAEYYLENIKQDFGEEAFQRALSSLEKHLNYHDSLDQGKQIKMRELLEEHRDQSASGDNGMTLQDLNALGTQAKERYEREYQWREIALSDGFKKLFGELFAGKGQECQMGEYTGRHTTSTNKTTDFSYQMLEMATYFVDFYKAGKKYENATKNILGHLKAELDSEIKEKSPSGKAPYPYLFERLRDAESGWQETLESVYSTDMKNTFVEILEKSIPDENDRNLFIKYMTVKGWSHSEKTIDRGDYVSVATLPLAEVVVNRQSFLCNMVNFFAENEDVLTAFLSELSGVPEQDNALPGVEALTGGENMIVYGAPGSGKSYYLDQLAKGASRTVFHAEYQHSDFVGGLRPTVDEDGDVTYLFVPGPFIKALLKAHKNPDKPVHLIIEEINRANAAAVFGDVFQLLDRDDNGTSEYSTTPDEALQAYLLENGYNSPTEMRIPSNLSIYATMNSSDQGVFSLDSAFKRRWQFHYCPINFIQHAAKDSFSGPVVAYADAYYSWTSFADTLNYHLKKAGVEEDRLLGPYFLSEKERANEDACTEAIAGKLLIYLWDDVLRHGSRELIFARDFRVFSDLVSAFRDGKVIFVKDVEDALKTCLVQADESGPLEAQG